MVDNVNVVIFEDLANILSEIAYQEYGDLSEKNEPEAERIAQEFIKCFKEQYRVHSLPRMGVMILEII